MSVRVPVFSYSFQPTFPPPHTHTQRAPILLLNEGTDTSQGKPQIISNINACEIVVDAVASTLGPRGMDKLIVDRNGRPPPSGKNNS